MKRRLRSRASPWPPRRPPRMELPPAKAGHLQHEIRGPSSTVPYATPMLTDMTPSQSIQPELARRPGSSSVRSLSSQSEPRRKQKNTCGVFSWPGFSWIRWKVAVTGSSQPSRVSTAALQKENTSAPQCELWACHRAEGRPWADSTDDSQKLLPPVPSVCDGEIQWLLRGTGLESRSRVR